MDMVEKITNLLSEVPPDLDAAQQLLAAHKLTEEEVMQIAINCTDNCFGEYLDALDPRFPDITVDRMHSNHIVSVLELLLEFGLNPNVSLNGENAMWNTMWISAPNVGATALRLMLEHGGDPNHRIPEEVETLFDWIDFKVSYDEYTHEYLHTVQLWWVLMAYGACFSNGKISITMLDGNSVEILKNFERYDFTIEPLPQEPHRYGCWNMHIYDKDTGKEVAVYR